MERWPYPNLPVYVVHPRDGEGCSWTLHRNYLLPINSNLEQGKKDEPKVGVGNDTSLPPVPSLGYAPAEAGLSRMVIPNLADNTAQGSPDWPAPLRHSTQTTRNQLPWRYWNSGLLANTGPTGIWMHGSTCASAYVSWFLCMPFSGDVQYRTHFTGNTLYLPSTTHSASRGTLSMQLLRWIPGQGREWTKGHLAQLQLLYQNTSSPKVIPIGAMEKCEAVLPWKASDRL